MKRIMHVFLTVLMLAVFSAGVWAEDPASDPAAKPAAKPAAAAPVPTITAADVQALKDAVAAQQLQIERLTQQLQRQQEWQAQQSAAQAAGKVDATQALPAPQQFAAANNAAASNATVSNAAVSSPTVNTTTVSNTTVSSSAPLQQDAAPSGGLNLQSQTEQNPGNPMHSPVVSIHFRGITITPGGFAAAEFVRRSRALGADIPTPFNSLTMPGASQSSLSEFFGSARQSRPTVYIDGRLKNVEFSSYLSGDFLSSGDTSTATQTNSYTFRLRQAWGQAKWDNGWSILGGQMWSLVTENKAGIAPSDDLGKTNDARPATIDPSYNVGFSFARQYGLRVTKDFNHKVAFAVAIENSQATLTTHGNPNNFLLGSAGAGNSYNNAITGCSTSSYTPTGGTTPVYYVTCTPAGSYSFNPAPDVIAKLAIDPGFGHYEVFGLYDRFRDRAFPCANFVIGTTGPCPTGIGTGPSAAGAYNASKNGGGIGVNARWNFLDKHIVFGIHGLGGSGIGRYGAAQLSDLAINADGTPALIKNFQGLTSLEWHGKKLDVYFYTGAEYDSRTSSLDAATDAFVGYGSPHFNNSGCYTETTPSTAVSSGFNPGSLGKCTADTRAVIEGTAGFWYNLYSGPKGRFRFGTQYSYVTRQTWSGVPAVGAPSGSPEGIDNMIYTSFRYYLP